MGEDSPALMDKLPSKGKWFTTFVKGIEWLKIYFCVQFTDPILGIVIFVKTTLDLIFTLFFLVLKY